MTASTPAERLAYASSPTTERLAAACATLVLLGIGALAIRLGARYLGPSDAVIPAVYAGSFVAMLVSATILRNQFRASGFAPLAFLSNAFGISALLLVPWLAVTPNVFSPTGLGYGNASQWLWITWHAAFILLVGGYVIGEAIYSRRIAPMEVARNVASRYGWTALLLASGTVAALLFYHAKLPQLGGPGTFAPLYHGLVERALLGIIGAVLIALLAATRLRNTTSLWLAVIVVALGVETFIAGQVARGQYTIAWYLVLGMGLVWQVLYLVVQLRHANEQLVAFAADKKTLIEVTLRDPLTGLLNRRGFDERFEDILTASRLANKAMSLLLFDIDHFKAFNDAFGHPAGDEALKAISESVASVANRPTDACCRVGGEEFAIVLGETDESGAMTVAERVRANVMRLRIAQAPEIGKTLTVSIGIATVDPKPVVETIELYERADKALYKAKRLGRNRIAAFMPARDSSPRIV